MAIFCFNIGFLFFFVAFSLRDPSDSKELYNYFVRLSTVQPIIPLYVRCGVDISGIFLLTFCCIKRTLFGIFVSLEFRV